MGTNDPQGANRGTGIVRTLDRRTTTCDISVAITTKGVTPNDLLAVRLDNLLGKLHERITEATGIFNQATLNKGGFQHLEDGESVEPIILSTKLAVTRGRRMIIEVTISPKVRLSPVDFVRLAVVILKDLEDAIYYTLDPLAVLSYMTTTFQETWRRAFVMGLMVAGNELGTCIAPLIADVPGPHQSTCCLHHLH
jgi:hypothetical protein